MRLSTETMIARLRDPGDGDTLGGRIWRARDAANLSTKDLADQLGVSRQVMSNQLACLRGCGLVETTPDGRRTEYRLADPHLAPALNELLQITLLVEPDCCDGEGCTCA